MGMGKALAASHAGAAALLGKAEGLMGPGFAALLADGPEEELKRTRFTQPALFTVSMMAMEIVREKGIPFDLVAGHSLGEYSALCAAGVFSFEEGLGLVKLRGELMEGAGEKQPGAMAAVLGLEASALEKVLEAARGAGIVVAANFNSPSQIVISGSVTGVERASALAGEAGAKKVVPLPVSGAFHSPLMEFARPGLEAGLRKVPFKAPSVPVLTNVEAEPCRDPERLRELLSLQLVSPVRWEAILRRALALGCTEALEVGAGKVLMGLARATSRDLKVIPVENPADLA